MREIRIEKLVLDHFKCHGHLELEPAGRSVSIYGDNASGKTSIYDSLTWLLFGKDSQGGAGMEVKPLGPDGQVLDHQAVTQVRAVLRVDGVAREFRRTYHELWSRKRGEEAPSFDGNTSEYYVDGVPCRKSQYLQKVSGLVDEEVFRMLTAIGRFAGELSWQQRREILYDLGKVPEDRELMEREQRFRPLLEDMGSLTLGEYAKKLQAEKKDLQAAGTDLPGRLSELEVTLRQLGQPDFEALRDRRRLLSQERDRMLSQQDPNQALRDRIREKQLDLRELETANEAYRKSQLEPVEQLQAQVRGLEQKLQAMPGAEAADRRIQRLQQAVEGEKTRKFRGGVCPTCGQPLGGTALEQAKESFLSEKKRRISAMNREIREILETKHEQEEQGRRLQQQLSRTREKLEEAKKARIRDLHGFAGKKKRWQGELKELESSLLESPDAEQRKLKKSNLDKQIRLLDRELGKETLIAATRTRGQRLRQEEELAQQRLEQIRSRLYLLEEFSRFKVGFAEQGVNSRFRLATFRLFREQIGGGLEPRCDVMLDGVPYGNLNTGARINVGIDIISTLSEHYGIRVPLFVDNAESVTQLEQMEGQVIRLVVSPSDPVLRME